MGALVMLVLAADLTLSPSAPPPPEPEAPEWNLGAQLTISALQSLNGTFLGIALCGATTCYLNGDMPLLFGVAGAWAGFALSVLDQEPARGWGRAAFLDLAILGAGLFSIALATHPALSLGSQLGYSLIFLTDAALTATALIAVRRVSPPLESVLLADSLGLWGFVIGAAAASLSPRNTTEILFLGSAGGLAAGAMMALSAQRMTWFRVLFANAAALVGALVVGGGLAMYEGWTASPQRPYDPVVPAAGLAAGIAGGFLVGFALSDSF